MAKYRQMTFEPEGRVLIWRTEVVKYIIIKDDKRVIIVLFRKLLRPPRNLAKAINWIGKGGKTAFSTLKIKDVLTATVRKKRLCSSATDSEIFKVAKNWFRFESDRDGGLYNGTMLGRHIYGIRKHCGLHIYIANKGAMLDQCTELNGTLPKIQLAIEKQRKSSITVEKGHIQITSFLGCPIVHFKNEIDVVALHRVLYHVPLLHHCTPSHCTTKEGKTTIRVVQEDKYDYKRVVVHNMNHAVKVYVVNGLFP
uniref:Uncharacterized protein n=1 Tax=Magallana gigas TaxID=29159 RepID=A0A8W8MM09_MAGGI